MLLNGLGKNMETEHDEDCVEERFQLAREKLDRNGNRGRKAVGMGNCSINIWIESELELACSKKIMFMFWKQFPNMFIIWYFEYIGF